MRAIARSLLTTFARIPARAPAAVSPLAGFLATTIAVCAFVLSGCASDDMRTSTVPDGPGKRARAHPASYGIVDTFSIGAPQHVRPPNDFLFYFKECDATDPIGDRAFFSKTAYSCSGAR